MPSRRSFIAICTKRRMPPSDAITGILREGATPADVVAASAVIEQAGFTTDDNVMHGYGGGYLPPIIGSKSRPAGKLPELTFQAGA